MESNTSFRPYRRAIRRRLAALLLAPALLGLAGCSVLPEAQPDPTRYYLLAAEMGAGAAAASPNESRTLDLALRVVELPGYLRNNRTLVVRRGVNEILYQDYARWAEPLDLAVQRIVRDRLLMNEAVSSAQVAPFSSEIERDFDISVRVLRCEGGVDGQGRHTAQFSASYEIADTREGGKIVAREVFNAEPTAWNGTDYGVLAERLSEAVAALGNEIVGKIPTRGGETP